LFFIGEMLIILNFNCLRALVVLVCQQGNVVESDALEMFQALDGNILVAKNDNKQQQQQSALSNPISPSTLPEPSPASSSFSSSSSSWKDLPRKRLRLVPTAGQVLTRIHRRSTTSASNDDSRSGDRKDKEKLEEEKEEEGDTNNDDKKTEEAEKSDDGGEDEDARGLYPTLLRPTFDLKNVNSAVEFVWQFPDTSPAFVHSASTSASTASAAPSSSSSSVSPLAAKKDTENGLGNNKGLPAVVRLPSLRQSAPSPLTGPPTKSEVLQRGIH
jgi:hypothetical protein